jgi:hypothetical protein
LLSRKEIIMRNKLAAFAILIAIGAPGAALAQGLNAGLGGDSGGVGIGTHGTGFSGTLGDPDYYVGTSTPPVSPPTYAPGYTAPGRFPGAAPGAGGFDYTPPPPPIQYYYGRPSVR